MELLRTRRDVPTRMVVYGADGVGKTTFAAGAPGAVFIPVEDGLHQLDALSTPRPDSWSRILEYANELVATKECQSIVIDSLDEAEQLCWAHTCSIPFEGKKMANIESFGYGKGYVAAVRHWRDLIAILDKAHDAGKGVVLLAHSQRKVVKNPTGEDYEQVQIKLQEKAGAMFREWAHVVGLAELDISTVTDAQTKRSKAVFGGRRVLRTSPGAGYQAKSRYPIPPRLPLEWAAYAAAVRSVANDTKALADALDARLKELADAEVEKGCRQYVERNGSTAVALSSAIETVDGYLLEKATNGTEMT